MAKQRIVVAMMDGMGLGYFNSGACPQLQKMAKDGFYKKVKGMFPSVTNVNNVSIATGSWPKDHGISANSMFDPKTNSAVYLNSGVQGSSVFSRAEAQGLKTALLTSKRKTKELFASHTSLAIAAEDLSPEEEARFGAASGIYSREINYWLWETAYTLLDTQPELDLIYVHITDYPMHAWSPEAEESKTHLKTLDSVMAKIASKFEDVAFFVTADHGMNFKTRCWDLTHALKNRSTPVRFVLSPERDYYIKHHRNFTGCAWLWLNQDSDRAEVRTHLLTLKGVESVEDSVFVAQKYHLDAHAMGDLVVFGDKDTMFGDMDSEYEDLPAEYRAHGSLHEMDLPLLIWNYQGQIPGPDYFTHNRNLLGFLFND